VRVWFRKNAFVTTLFSSSMDTPVLHGLATERTPPQPRLPCPRHAQRF
jgi:hypothetical protein